MHKMLYLFLYKMTIEIYCEKVYNFDISEYSFFNIKGANYIGLEMVA